MKKIYEGLFQKINPLVENKFKEFLYLFINQYKNNPTRRKAAHLIMNIPVGFFIDYDDVAKMFKNNRPPTHDEMVSFLSDRENLLKLIGGK